VLANIVLSSPLAQAVLILGSNLDNYKVSSNLLGKTRDFTHRNITLSVLNYVSILSVAVP
jgi:hypothetical protein